MKTHRHIASLSLLTVLCLALAVAPASANTLYSNGSINGNLNAFFIDGPGGPIGQSISDEFVDATTGNGTTLNFGEWTLGGAPTVVSWSLGTSSFGIDIASGGGAVTSTFLGTNAYGYGVYNTQISISGALTAGNTYYLTLSGANDMTAAFLAAQTEGDPRRRVLVINPEAGADHIHPIELRDGKFRNAPNNDGEMQQLVQAIVKHIGELSG